MSRDRKPTAVQRYAWHGVASLSGTVATLAVRQVAKTAWRTGRNEEPPTSPAGRDVSWHDALIWAISVAVGAAVARVVTERLAATAWKAATGTPPPIAEA